MRRTGTAMGISALIALFLTGDKAQRVLAAANGVELKAVAQISGCTDPGISGSAVFLERTSSEGVKVVDVFVTARGLSDGKHAVHVHETGACAPCSAARGHFDPGPAGLSSPDGNHPFHSGDLVNLNVRDGVGKMRTITNRITLSPGRLSVFDADGSAVIIHVGPDTYCPDGSVAGCAGGARAACGVIVPYQGREDLFDKELPGPSGELEG